MRDLQRQKRVRLLTVTCLTAMTSLSTLPLLLRLRIPRPRDDDRPPTSSVLTTTDGGVPWGLGTRGTRAVQPMNCRLPGAQPKT